MTDYALMSQATGQRQSRCPECARKTKRSRPLCAGCGDRADSYRHRIACRKRG